MAFASSGFRPPDLRIACLARDITVSLATDVLQGVEFLHWVELHGKMRD